MPIVTFTKEDFDQQSPVEIWKERLDWLRECASKPAERPPIVHRAYMDDPSAHTLIRDFINDARRSFYDDGTVSPILTELYKQTLY
jgi:hypothetical protein